MEPPETDLERLTRTAVDRVFTPRELTDFVVKFAGQISRLNDNDLDQHEDIRQALMLIRSTSAAVELLLRDKYAAPMVPVLTDESGEKHDGSEPSQEAAAPAGDSPASAD